jgi:hypothetical protein
MLQLHESSDYWCSCNLMMACPCPLLLLLLLLSFGVRIGDVRIGDVRIVVLLLWWIGVSCPYFFCNGYLDHLPLGEIKKLLKITDIPLAPLLARDFA